MTGRDGIVAWEEWLLMPARVAFHQPTRTAIAADLHLGYAEARRRGGDAIPLHTVDEQLLPLDSAIRTLEPMHLVVAGDVFEATPSEDLSRALLEWVSRLGMESVLLLPGNHDRKLAISSTAVQVVNGPITVGEWQVVHGDGERPSGKVVQGHVHPALRTRRGVPAVPCFLTAGDHLILPAYSADAAGGDVSRGERWKGYRCFVIAGQVLDLGLLGSRPEKQRRR